MDVSAYYEMKLLETEQKNARDDNENDKKCIEDVQTLVQMPRMREQRKALQQLYNSLHSVFGKQIAATDPVPEHHIKDQITQHKLNIDKGRD